MVIDMKGDDVAQLVIVGATGDRGFQLFVEQDNRRQWDAEAGHGTLNACIIDPGLLGAAGHGG